MSNAGHIIHIIQIEEEGSVDFEWLTIDLCDYTIFLRFFQEIYKLFQIRFHIFVILGSV